MKGMPAGNVAAAHIPGLVNALAVKATVAITAKAISTEAEGDERKFVDKRIARVEM